MYSIDSVAIWLQNTRFDTLALIFDYFFSRLQKSLTLGCKFVNGSYDLLVLFA